MLIVWSPPLSRQQANDCIYRPRLKATTSQSPCVVCAALFTVTLTLTAVRTMLQHDNGLLCSPLAGRRPGRDETVVRGETAESNAKSDAADKPSVNNLDK